MVIHKVVILSVRRLTGRRVGSLVHYARRELGELDIFSKYFLKYLECTRICSNILEYTRIFPC
jgi:hypothetical protein